MWFNWKQIFYSFIAAFRASFTKKGIAPCVFYLLPCICLGGHGLGGDGVKHQLLIGGVGSSICVEDLLFSII
jgi:hypothetical protein